MASPSASRVAPRPEAHQASGAADAPESPHVAARIDAFVQGALVQALRRRGWGPGIAAYTSYGHAGWARVLARVVLVPPPPRAGEREKPVLVGATRGWRGYLAIPMTGVPASVSLGGVTCDAASDHRGYLDEVLDVDLDPGWHHAVIEVDGARPARSRVLVIGEDQNVGIISDIDDTVLQTAIPRPFLAFWNTFVRREQARRAVPGMSELFAELRAAVPGAPVLYLSTGAWTVAPVLRRFLSRNGFPEGPLLLTDWAPTATGWFRDGRAHKRRTLHRLVEEMPGMRWLLIGDDGQHDPEIYDELAGDAPEHVLGIAIRELSATQQLLAHGGPAPLPGNAGRAGAASMPPGGGRRVPRVSGPHGYALWRRLREHEVVLARWS